MSKYANYRLIIANECAGGWKERKKGKARDEYERINFIDLGGTNGEGLLVLQLLQLHVSLL